MSEESNPTKKPETPDATAAPEGDGAGPTDAEATGAGTEGASAAAGSVESDSADAPDAGAAGTAADAREAPADDMSQEAIARRVAALSTRDETDADAEAAEAKLRARREKQEASKKKKGGLEVAASKRLAKIGEKTGDKAEKKAARRIAPAADQDPLLERTTQIGRWLKQNQKLVSAISIAAVLGLVGFGGYAYMEHRKELAASTALSAAVEAQQGRIGDPEKEKEQEADDRFHDPRPVFKTVEDRREAALEKYRAVAQQYPGTGAAILARLSEASLLLDKRDADGALAAFEQVKGSPLAAADAEVRGRALEGLGFAHELKAQDGDKARLEAAAKAFRELENTDVKGFKELGMYHQGRVFEAQGDRDKAKEILKSAYERVTKPGENHPFPYLETVIEDRLRALDPNALPPKPASMFGTAPGGGKSMNEAQIRQLIEQMRKQQEQGGDPHGDEH